jgi:nicotinate-nucleotide adenylyltransferase
MESYRSNRRIGVFGGSFDPVHMGHLIIAQDAAERLELSEVVFIPAAIPPHKQHLQRAEPKHRLSMLQQVVESDVRFSVSDIELQRGGISYTADTMQVLRELYGSAELFLIIGSDTLVDLHLWQNTEKLFSLCEVATFIRPGEDCPEKIMEKIQLPDAVKTRLMSALIEAHRVEISSTEIRMRVAEGLSIRYLVPSEVEMYIFEHGLYKG